MVTVLSDSDDEANDEGDSMSSGSDDEESYVPSPEVLISIAPSPLLSSCVTPSFNPD